MDHKVCFKRESSEKKKKSTELWFFVSLSSMDPFDGYLWILENCLYFDALLFLQLHLSLTSALILPSFYFSKSISPFISMLFFLFCKYILVLGPSSYMSMPSVWSFSPRLTHLIHYRYIYLHISVYYVYLFGVDNSCFFFFLTFWMIWISWWSFQLSIAGQHRDGSSNRATSCWRVLFSSLIFTRLLRKWWSVVF